MPVAAMHSPSAATPHRDDEGYLVDPHDWNEQIAMEIADEENLPLTEEHWKIFGFMRASWHEHQIAPDARFVIKYLGNDLGYGREARKRLFQLFPYGYVKQACKISGMKRPRAWSTG